MSGQTIFLYGPPGSGKSSIGRKLAKQLNRKFVDLDALIEEKSSKTIPEIFKQDGEKVFRSLEKSALQEASFQSSGAVIALGGGALLDDENRRFAEKNGKVLCLDADYKTLLNHLRQSKLKRPLLDDDLENRLSSLLTDRNPHYQSFDLLNVKKIGINKAVELAQRKLGIFHVSGMGSGYDVMVSPGLIKQIGKILQDAGIKGSLMLVSDNNVAPHYAGTVMKSLQSAGYKVSLLELPAGEEHKTIETLQSIWQAFLEAGMERSSTAIALGGGVVSDMTGFAAATYKRGIPWIVCPTTLLAMVDAGLGGKTGADLPAGKNLVGAFHAPQMVLVDPDCLKTLPEEELRNGMGEVIKHGIIADPQLFELCRGNWRSELPRLVTDAMAVKIKIICEDPLEKGRRAVLNLGHTVGHAIEQASDFKIKHGEAVAVGLLAAAQIAKDMGLVSSDHMMESIVGTLRYVGLPTQIPESINLDQAMEIMQHDKKRAGGVVRFVLPIKIGNVREGYQVDPVLVKSVMTDLQEKNDLEVKQ